MNQNPITILLITGLTIYIAIYWWNDTKKSLLGQHEPSSLPGAYPTTAIALFIAIIGSLVILAIETCGELLLGIAEKQSTISWLFLLVMISVGFYEEILFRGYLVIENKGRRVLILSIFVFSALFALIHFHWIDWKGMKYGWFEFDISLESCYWTSILFVNSLWFYTVRFFVFNKTKSLLPSIAAHIVSNSGVFIVKLVQGHVIGLY